jgi:membrane-associated protein
MGELFTQIRDVFLNLFDGPALMRTLEQPEITIAAFIALNLIVFVETGLFCFFLPGDSLLVTAGLVAWNADWNVYLLMGTLCIAAIVGDSVGYWIGYRSGPRLFTREDSWFWNRKHIERAHAFYEQHGGKTIIIARFIPIIRTFAPVVAGVGQMEYKRFLSFNVFGGIGWVVSMVLLGYCLTPFLDPLLKPIFGEGFQVQKHIEWVIIIVVLLSISPALYAGFKHWMAKRRGTQEEVDTPKPPQADPEAEAVKPTA